MCIHSFQFSPVLISSLSIFVNLIRKCYLLVIISVGHHIFNSEVYFVALPFWPKCSEVPLISITIYILL